MSSNIEIKEYENFFQQLDVAVSNSFLFENASEKIEYVNQELNNFKETRRGLHYFSNWFIDKYHKRLIDTAYLIAFTSAEEKAKYSGDPALLSYDRFGTTDLWYVILLLNNMGHPNEFVNLDKCYIPDINEIEKIIAEEENNIKALEG